MNSNSVDRGVSSRVWAALEAAGYRDYGPHHDHADAVCWQRRVGGVSLTVWDYPPSPMRPTRHFELEVYEHDDGCARKLLVYGVSAVDFAWMLPEMERRALAAMAALRASTPSGSTGERDEGDAR